MKGNQFITLLQREIGPSKPVFIIAEIGVNHDGNIEKAKRLIRAAKESGADAIKFQKRDIDAIYPKTVLDNLDAQEHSFQYAVRVQRETELSKNDYSILADFAKSLGIIFFATPFDESSVEFLETIGVPFYKVGSCDLTNFVLLEKIISTQKPIILSTGMSTLEEIDATAKFLNDRDVSFALLHCQSTYPANLEDLALDLIPFYRNRYGVPVGYSGHERDIDTTVAAVAMGASIIERHITLDQNGDGPDHAASLEPNEFKSMIKKIRKIERAKPGLKRLSQGELINRQVLGKSLAAARDVARGERIERSMVTAKSSPESGLSPQHLYELVGRSAVRAIKRDSLFEMQDISGGATQAPMPRFESRWGLKAGFSDFEGRIRSNVKLLEFHLTEPDLRAEFAPKRRYDIELILHVPIYGKGELIVDLCSLDEQKFQESLAITQATIDLAKRMAPYFSGAPRVVMHVGGMTIEPAGKEQWGKMLERAAEAFRKLDTKGIEFLPENLTSLAWHKGGQWYQNVFNKPEEITSFCRQFNLRMCFDTSHAWLASHFFKFDFYQFLGECAPFIAHMHVADGRAPNDEGLQIGDGEIDFKRVFDILEQHQNPDVAVSWLPEIWQGHVEDLKGFTVALERLQALQHPFLKNG